MLKLNTVALLLCMCVVLLSCQSAIGVQRLCGKALPLALDRICYKGYNSKVKKSMDLDDYAYNEGDDELALNFEGSPFMEKMFSDSANALAKTRRRRHGVYEECCRKGCSYTELMSYCLP